MADWWRSWHGAPTDPKWLVVARKANATPPQVTAVAWALFDYASQHDERGCVDGFDSETYAVWAGMEQTLVDDIIAAMADKQMIVDGRLAAWRKRQPQREDSSTERVRAHRARVTRALTKEETQGNDDETRCNADETHGNAPEGEGETELETEPESESETDPEGTGNGERARDDKAPVPAASGADAPPRASSGATDAEIDATVEILMQCAWVQDDQPAVRKHVARAFALVPGFAPRDGPLQAELYGLHKPHHRKPPADWYRAWLNWLKQAVTFRERDRETGRNDDRANGRKPETTLDRNRQAIAEYRASAPEP